MVLTGETHNAWLEEITTLTAAGFPGHLAPLVICAYRTGCTLEQVLEAIEAGKDLDDLAAPALRPAWKTAHDWAWIARRRASVTGDTVGDRQFVDGARSA